MSDTLAALALRYRPQPVDPACPGCGTPMATKARIVVLVHEVAKAGRRGRQVVSRTRTMCPECVARAFEVVADALPDEQAHPGGRPVKEAPDA